MSENFNPENPLERFLYSSESEVTRAWEELLQGPAHLLGSSPAGRVSLEDPSLCPESGVWVSLACEQVREEERAQLLAHAAVCSSCADGLRRSQELFSAEISEEDAAFLSGSEMASPPGVHHLAVALAHTPLPVGRRSLLSGITFWAGATAAVVLLATVSLGIWFQHRRSPERVLAEVYTHCRCYDMRLAGADYSSVNPRSRMRGLESSQDLTALFKIRRQIEENLQSSPADPYWLQMEARVDLLEEKIDPAVAILDSLLLSAPSNVALLEDDAMAHYQRGIITACEADREIALERLKRADDLAPDNSVVLFNEAIVQEDRQQLSLAAQTWNRYLHLERDPQWISEGRSRLQKLEVKMQNSPGK